MENKKEQTEKSECSVMKKETILYILKALKEQGIIGTDKFIDFWEKQ